MGSPVAPLQDLDLTRPEVPHSDVNALVGSLARHIETVRADSNCIEVFEQAREDQDRRYIPVLTEDGNPLGIIDRQKALEQLGHRYFRELHRRSPIRDFVLNRQIIDASMTTDELMAELSRKGEGDYEDVFMVTLEGRYLGILSVQTLLPVVFERKQRALAAERDKVAEQNKLIMQGIQYASLIQSALLPQPQILDAIMGDWFAIWSPRDPVGGDIYLVQPLNGGYVVAVADCTGHGVPGALMTMIVSTGLSRVIQEPECADNPALMLKRLNGIVKSALKQDQASARSGANDGLDAAICIVYPGSGSLIYSGAKINLVCMENGATKNIRADKQSIGYRQVAMDYAFSNHRIETRPGMRFFLFTDGFIDQPGGERGFQFGTRRFLKLLAEHSDKPLFDHAELLMRSLDDYRGTRPRVDDVTVVGFTVGQGHTAETFSAVHP